MKKKGGGDKKRVGSTANRTESCCCLLGPPSQRRERKLPWGVPGVIRALVLPVPIWPTSSWSLRSQLHKPCYLKWSCWALHAEPGLPPVAGQPSPVLSQAWPSVSSAWKDPVLNVLNAVGNAENRLEAQGKKLHRYQQVIKTGIALHVFPLVCLIV